jgi:hypothetical protein
MEYFTLRPGDGIPSTVQSLDTIDTALQHNFSDHERKTQLSAFIQPHSHHYSVLSTKLFLLTLTVLRLVRSTVKKFNEGPASVTLTLCAYNLHNKLHLTETGCEDVVWHQMAQDRIQ